MEAHSAAADVRLRVRVCPALVPISGVQSSRSSGGGRLARKVQTSSPSLCRISHHHPLLASSLVASSLSSVLDLP